MCEYLRPVVALEHDDSKPETTSHGDVENIELSDTTQVTGDHKLLITNAYKPYNT